LEEALAGHLEFSPARQHEHGRVRSCKDAREEAFRSLTWSHELTPAAVPVLRDIKRYRAQVHALMTPGVNRCAVRISGCVPILERTFRRHTLEEDMGARA
jgi:hypothetical protein